MIGSAEGWETDKNYGLERGQISSSHLAELLSFYYHNRNDLAEAGKWCRDKLLDDKYKWTTIVGQLNEIIERMLKKPIEAGEGFGKKQ